MSNLSVIKYESSFKKKDMVRTKLKTVTTQGRIEGTEMCATFDTGGIEQLLYVIEDFALVMDSLSVSSSDDLFSFFKKILGHGPSEKFKRMRAKNFYVDTVVNNNITESAFQRVMKYFI